MKVTFIMLKYNVNIRIYMYILTIYDDDSIFYDANMYVAFCSEREEWRHQILQSDSQDWMFVSLIVF